MITDDFNKNEESENPIHDLSYTTAYLLKLLSGSTEPLEMPDKRRANGTYTYLSMLYRASAKGTVAVHRVWERIRELRPELARLIGTPEVSLTENLPPVDQHFIFDCLSNEEGGDADLLAHLYKDRLCYDFRDKKWYMWTGHHWEVDGIEFAYRLVEGQVVAQYRLAAADLDKQIAAEHDSTMRTQLEGKRDALLKRCRGLHTLKRIKSVIELARKRMVFSGEWDNQPWLLAVKNGVIDLKTGQLLSGRPQDYLRHAAPIKWEGLQASAPRFEQFVHEIMGDNVEMVSFLQRLFGYSMTGLTSEHVMAIFYGEEGRNGKDTLLETIGTVLGELATAGTNDLLIENTQQGGQASPHLCRLVGRRLVWVSETRSSAKLNTNQVKAITGGGRIACRPLYGEEMNFQPTHLLILQTNHRPRIPEGGDPALWKRLMLVPFDIRFVENPKQQNERQRDPFLREKLASEASGILTWLVKGCLTWQKEGLNPPTNVKTATTAYEQEEDVIQQFISAACVMGDDQIVSAKDLYDAFKEWGGSLSQTTFGRRLSKLVEKKRTTGGRFVYVGIGLVGDNSEESSEE